MLTKVVWTRCIISLNEFNYLDLCQELSRKYTSFLRWVGILWKWNRCLLCFIDVSVVLKNFSKKSKGRQKGLSFNSFKRSNMVRNVKKTAREKASLLPRTAEPAKTNYYCFRRHMYWLQNAPELKVRNHGIGRRRQSSISFLNIVPAGLPSNRLDGSLTI